MLSINANIKIKSVYGENLLEPSKSNVKPNTYQNIGRYDIPITTNFSKWGTIQPNKLSILGKDIENKDEIIRISKPSSILTIEVLVKEDCHYVKIFNKNSLVLQFIDYLGENFTSFKRELGSGKNKTIFIYKNNTLTLYQK